MVAWGEGTCQILLDEEWTGHNTSTAGVFVVLLFVLLWWLDSQAGTSDVMVCIVCLLTQGQMRLEAKLNAMNRCNEDVD